MVLNIGASLIGSETGIESAPDLVGTDQDSGDGEGRHRPSPSDMCAAIGPDVFPTLDECCALKADYSYRVVL
jgi:hypothetical protein